MSLHAHLSPEALARLEAQRRNSTVSSVVIAFLAITLMGLILGLILLPTLWQETSPFAITAKPILEERRIDPEKVNTSLNRLPAAPSFAMARVIVSDASSMVSIPVPDLVVPSPSVSFGDGNDFGSGWGPGGDSTGPGGDYTTLRPDIRKRCSKADRLLRLQETGGTPECDDAVVKALHWLKGTQSQDGSWAGGSAMTGLALLAYLGHCETPRSMDFGDTVLRGITHLVDLGMKHHGKLSDNPASKHFPYEHAIATYALAEATTFCKQLDINIPNLQEVTQQAGQFIIDNQNASGGWDYSYIEGGGRGGDLSITAWQIQALKACKPTGLDFRNLSKCIKGATGYVEKLAAPNGSFGYSRAGERDSLTGAGTLCLQLWDKGGRAAARNGVNYIDRNITLEYHGKSGDLYCHYYHAQAMMNRGGEAWRRYNSMFRDQLLNNQNADGSWKVPGGGMQMNPHYATCLATLMMEVYYRFLPGTGGAAGT